MINALEISLIITAIHVSMWEGMIFSGIRVKTSNLIDRFFPSKTAHMLKKPLFDCLICMGGIWSLIIYPMLFGFDINILKTMLEVIGINTIISGLISRLYE